MVAPCHPLLTLPGGFVLLLFWTIPTSAQVGLRTLPLTAPHNRSSLGLFSKWTGPKSTKGLNSSSIENELAAIFRGVAYGVSTEATTTTTTTTPVPTTTTTSRRIYNPNFKLNPNADVPPSSIPVSPPWSEKEEDARPVQHQHVDNPKPDTDYESEDYDSSKTSDSKEVFDQPDVGVSEISWLSVIGVLWQVHVYSAAALFTLLALCSLYFLARLHITSQLLPRGYYITIHLLVFLASFFRCIVFFHDPYAVEERLPNGLSNVLFNTGIPCIIMALAMLVLGLLRAARLKILPLNLQSPLAVAIVSAALIAGSIVVDILGGVLEREQLSSGLRAGMQALTAGWGAALCLGYMAIFSKIEKEAKRQQNEASRLTFTRVHADSSTLTRKFIGASLSYGARATLIAAASGLVLAVLQVYGLMNTEGILTVPPAQPWVWFAYHTSCRCLEVIMWSCICFSSALPTSIAFNNRKNNSVDDGQLLTVFACKSCTSCSNLSTCCSTNEKKGTNDLYSSICQSNHVARKFSFQNGRKPVMQDTIAATARSTPSQINTTLAAPKTKTSLGMSATLHANPNETQALWNNYNFNTASTSRPSSLILSENGAIRFRTLDPRQESVHVIDFKNQNIDSKSKKCDIKPSMNDNENNYINSSCHTPSKSLNLNAYCRDQYDHNLTNEDSPELYAEIIQNHGIDGNFGEYRSPDMLSPVHGTRKYMCSPKIIRHQYDEYEIPPYYHGSPDWGPHIYASLQPIEDNPNEERSVSQGNKYYNNSHLHFQAPASPKPDAPGNVPHEFRAPHGRRDQFCSDSDLCSSDYMLNQREGRSSSKSMCFQPHINDLNTPHSTIQSPHHQIHDGRDHCDIRDEPEDQKGLLHHSSKGIFSKIVPSNFGNCGYAPLSSDETSSLLSDDPRRMPATSQNRSNAHRPRKSKHSPTSHNAKLFSKPTPPYLKETPNTKPIQYPTDGKSGPIHNDTSQTEITFQNFQLPNSRRLELDLHDGSSLPSSPRPPSSMVNSDLEANSSGDESADRTMAVRWSPKRKVVF